MEPGFVWSIYIRGGGAAADTFPIKVVKDFYGFALCFCGLGMLVYYYVCIGCLHYSMFYGFCFYLCSAYFCIKMLKKTFKCGVDSWCECMFLIAWTWGARVVKSLLQVSGGWILQSEVVRTLSDHAAGRQPGSYWREHDDPVNYKGDITQVNLIVQTHRDVINWLSNLLSDQLTEESRFHTFSLLGHLIHIKRENSTETGLLWCDGL